jgi:hypothetical protein
MVESHCGYPVQGREGTAFVTSDPEGLQRLAPEFELIRLRRGNSVSAITSTPTAGHMIEARLASNFRFQLWFVGLMTCGIGALLMNHVAKAYVQRLNVEGIVLRNGKSFNWGDLQKACPVYTKRRQLNHVDLVFENGKVGLYFRSFDNGGEVLDFVRRMTGDPLPAIRPR